VTRGASDDRGAGRWSRSRWASRARGSSGERAVRVGARRTQRDQLGRGPASSPVSTSRWAVRAARSSSSQVAGKRAPGWVRPCPECRTRRSDAGPFCAWVERIACICRVANLSSCGSREAGPPLPRRLSGRGRSSAQRWSPRIPSGSPCSSLCAASAARPARLLSAAFFIALFTACAFVYGRIAFTVSDGGLIVRTGFRRASHRIRGHPSRGRGAGALGTNYAVRTRAGSVQFSSLYSGHERLCSLIVRNAGLV